MSEDKTVHHLVEVKALVGLDSCEKILRYWMHHNKEEAAEMFAENMWFVRNMLNRVVDDNWYLSRLTEDELGGLEVALRAEQFRRGDGHEF